MQLAQTDAKNRLKILMLERRIRPADLARAVGLTRGYLYGLIGGQVSTNAGRQRITDFMGEEIWPGILPAAKIAERDGRAPESTQTAADQEKNHERTAGREANGPEPPAER